MALAVLGGIKTHELSMLDGTSGLITIYECVGMFLANYNSVERIQINVITAVLGRRSMSDMPSCR